jgi:hypothetical protein
MRSTILLSVALLVIAAAPAAANHRPGHKPSGNLTISAGSTLIKFGSSVTLSGKLTGPNPDGKSVTVQADPFPFAAFDTIGTVTTNTTGDWSFINKPAVNTRYRARQGGAESPEVTVNVRAAISLRVSDSTPRAGARVRFSGRLCPEHDGATIALQRRASKGFRTVRTTTLADAGSCSTYSKRLRVRRDGVYRAFFAGDPDTAAGPSRRRRINVGCGG